MAGNENAAAGERSRDTAGRDRSYGGGDRDKDRDKADRERVNAKAKATNPGLKAGYMSGNPYPGYRGPTGTRNPKSKPEATPKNAGFSQGDKPAKPSIWDKFFSFGRRKPATAPSYKATLHNMGVLSGVMPGPGMPAKIAGMIAGIGPQYRDYTGVVNTPGEWDPKDKIADTGLPDYASIFYHKIAR